MPIACLLKRLSLLLALPALAGAGFADRPVPLPPNPHNNPWLVYPATYGAGTKQDHTRDITADAVARTETHLARAPAERASFVQAEENRALQHGRALFNSPRLGTLGLTCQSCHTDGGTSGGSIGVGRAELPIPPLKGVALRYPRYNAATGRVITQTEMQNNCIAMFMKGTRLPAESRDAADLTLFVSRFQPE